MTKLYDLYVNDDKSAVTVPLQMRAPLAVIAQVLKLHKDAVKRIERETERGGVCQLFNGMFNGNGHDWIVQRATTPLSTDIE